METYLIRKPAQVFFDTYESAGDGTVDELNCTHNDQVHQKDVKQHDALGSFIDVVIVDSLRNTVPLNIGPSIALLGNSRLGLLRCKRDRRSGASTGLGGGSSRGGGVASVLLWCHVCGGCGFWFCLIRDVRVGGFGLFNGQQPEMESSLWTRKLQSEEARDWLNESLNPGAGSTLNLSLAKKAPVTVNYHDLQLPAYIMGAVVAGGGIMGYAKSGSVPSIVAGCTVGLLYALGGYRIQNEESYGVELALLASAVLGGSAFPRALRLRKPVPILLSVISAFGLFTFGTALRR
ncbi:hypothetical protein HG531_011948 [Fusarium graminearum]|nr:hypothetical protein HG531_011948 [Fusarium graminearum]